MNQVNCSWPFLLRLGGWPWYLVNIQMYECSSLTDVITFNNYMQSPPPPQKKSKQEHFFQCNYLLVCNSQKQSIKKFWPGISIVQQNMNWVRIGPIDERWFLIKKFPLGRNEPKTPGGTPTSQIRGREKYI